MDIYVGNLSYDSSEETVSDAFSEFGNVDRVKIITDRETGRSKGFGFVTMKDEAEGNAAIEGMNGASLEGRPLRVNEARPREDAPAGKNKGRRDGGSPKGRS